MFLKKIQKIVIKESNKLILFFDESRFGTHSKVSHGWFEKGIRSTVSVNLGYKNFYVYSAVSSLTGYNFSLILPQVNTNNMNIFLNRLSKSLKNQKAILIMDSASWHKSRALKVPSNIEIIHLPAYSPELNPTEKLWQYIKSHVLKNKLYTCINKLEEAVCDFIKKLTIDEIKSNCACNYLFI